MGQKKWVYFFSAEKTEGNKNQKDLLGGKGANLAEMCLLKIPVPPGFTVSTEACFDFYQNSSAISEDIRAQVIESIAYVEKLTGKKFGGDPTGKSAPLLFSVRSGARASMPGMMDTVLNLGLNDQTVKALIQSTNNPRFAWDSYRRFIQMFSDVVLDINTSVLESTLEDLKEARNVTLDTDLTAEDLEELVSVYKNILMQEHGITFPTDPMEQLWKSIGAVFNSWNNPRAKRYRELHNYPDSWGTAVNIQSMVYGNMGNDSATGVCFTRDPSTGEKKFFGEYLVNAQGEDVVAGIRTPAPINEDSKNESNKTIPSLEKLMPIAFKELEQYYKKLEGHYKDMQDIEFTIEKSKLYILQTRNGKRTTSAALKIASDLVNEKVITVQEALKRVKPEDLNQLLHPTLDPKAKKIIIATGLPASPGAAAGYIAFSNEEAQKIKESGKKVLLVRQETSPEDISGMIAAEGILTARGGMTSHAAVVARGMGKPCVAGCSALFIDANTRTLTVKGKTYRTGDTLTLDGATGEVMEGIVPTTQAKLSQDFVNFMNWAKETKKLAVRANADNPEDARVAISFGAQGIGLCRTEHMFFDSERILAVREMIFAETTENRARALKKLLPYQKEDFIGIFNVMDGLPVTIRLLDPPLHEFLPHTEPEKQELANSLGVPLKYIEARGNVLHEFNPMLGHRGCRLAITFPEIYLMQTRAIIEAALVSKKKGLNILPEIMIPLIGDPAELSIIKDQIMEEIKKVFQESKDTIAFKIGTMIELPRAALLADQIAQTAEFFSFGTNDLTQTTYGLSRDDAGKFLPEYLSKGIYTDDPFVTLDVPGVGQLIKMAKEKGKGANPKIHIGICGEHGGDPRSIDFCHSIGLDYVSCSPYRVPIAILAAAQANLNS